MLPARKADPWFVDILAEEPAIALRCLAVMDDSEKLRFNICDLESSFVTNAEVAGLAERVKKNIPPPVQYAAFYWADHIVSGPCSTDLLTKLSDFVDAHLLSWFEVMSLLGSFFKVGSILHGIAIWASVRPFRLHL